MTVVPRRGRLGRPPLPGRHRGARIATASGLGAALLLLSAAAEAAQTIVGTWAPDPRQCSPANAVYVGALDLFMGDEYRCSFRDVARSGDVVTWHGACGGPEQPKDRSTVVAELRGRSLSLWLNGARNGPYLRCRPD